MSDDILKKYLADLERDADAMQEQSFEAESDVVFVSVTGGMWENFSEDIFDKRIKMEFNLVAPYVNQKIGQWNQNRVSVEFKSDSLGTTDDDAELINGIYRADFRENSGKMAIDNAVHEVMKCGYGCFKLMAEFEDEEDIDNDLQKIVYAPIYNAYQTVFWEANAKNIDKSDATICHELIRFTKEAYEETWPDASFTSAYEPSNIGFAHTHNSINSNISDSIFIAKRYEVIKKKENIYKYFDLEEKKVVLFNEVEHKLKQEELESSELEGLGIKRFKFKNKRHFIKQHIETTLFNGKEILEKTKRIAGKFIPIIPMYAYRTYVDGTEHYQGLVRALKDPARTYNAQVSQLIENAASTGQEIPIVAPEQIEGFEEEWSNKNQKAFLYANPLRDDDGKIVQAGIASYLKPAQLDQSTTTLLQIVPGFMQTITGGAPQDIVDKNMTGKLFRAIQKREDMNTQIIYDNISNSIQWSGKVYKDMALDGIYTLERMVTILSPEGVEGRKILQEKIFDNETGGTKKTNDLNNKKFRVYADIGPQYESVREETVETLKGMLEVLKGIGQKGEAYISPAISTIIENISGSGLGPIKKLNRQQMISQGLIEPETDEEKQQLEQIRQKAKLNPNQDLIKAAANQANAEARERDSKTLVNAADANLKQAKAQEVISNVSANETKAKNETAKNLLEIREQVFENVQELPL